MKLVALHMLPIQGVSHKPETRKQVMLQAADVPHLTNFSQARFAPGQTAAGHRHADMAEVFFVEASRGVIIIDHGRV